MENRSDIDAAAETPEDRIQGSRRQRQVLWVIRGLCGLSLLATLGLGAWHLHRTSTIAETSRAAARQAVADVAAGISVRLDALLRTDSLAQTFATAPMTARQVQDRLAAMLRRHPQIGALTAGFLPAYAPPSIARVDEADIYFIHAGRVGDSLRYVEGFYTAAQRADTTRGDITRWYRRPLDEGRPVWNGEPYYSPLTRAWWSGGYGVPFTRTRTGTGTPEVAGLLYADLTLDQIREVVFSAVEEQLSAFPIEASYAFVVSEAGAVISHPDRAVVERKTRLIDFDPTLHTPAAIEALPERPDGIHVLADHRDARSGQEAYVFFARIPSAGWWVATVLDKQAVFQSNAIIQAMRAGKLRVAVALIVFLLMLTALVVRVDRGEPRRLWAVSVVAAVLFLAGIVYSWSLHRLGAFQGSAREAVLLNSAIPAKVRIQYHQAGNAEPLVIPTGVFVQSVEFSNANNVTVTGYIWQRYADGLPDWVRPADADTPGFILPESESLDVSAAYTRRDGDAEVFGWTFNAVLRQEFDYSHYPFDREDLWIRLWHHAFGRGVVLTPDFAAYDTLAPQQLPGLEQQDFVLEGWTIDRAFFSYRPNRYNTNFGLPAYTERHGFPELYYNLELTRSFLNPFIANFIPLLVVAFLLFAVLLTIRLHPQSTDLLGFNTSAVLAFCAALFFVVIVAHTSLRESLAVERIIYLEHFFFAEYIAILAVAINSILIARPQRSRWVAYEDNLMARLLYWPLFWGALLIITLFTFS